MKQPPRWHKRFKRYHERGIPIDKLQSLILDEDPPIDLQEDHVASRQHDSELVAPVSTKAHRRLERNRRAAGMSRKHERNAIKRAIERLKSSAVFKELEAEAMMRWAEDLARSLKK